MECEVCGNNYDKPMTVQYQGEEHIFDSFECAITALAPRCANCDARILGHGMEADSETYCCAHCARMMGHDEMRDRA